MDIIAAMQASELFRRWFPGDSWDSWKVFLCVLFGLEMTPEQEKIYHIHTGRLPSRRPVADAEKHGGRVLFREAYVCVGRRGGKSLILSLAAVWLACFVDYAGVLQPGEVGVCMILASDRRQARVLFRYIRSFIVETPLLASMLTGETATSLTLERDWYVIAIEIATASRQSVRGYTCIGILADELSVWDSEDASDPDTEILNAARATLLTTKGPLLAIGSPYAKRGEMYANYRDHYGKENSSILVWAGSTLSMNPVADPQLIEHAYTVDEAAARAEYGSLDGPQIYFRDDIESFIDAASIEALQRTGMPQLPYVSKYKFASFADFSSGKHDSSTLCVGHLDGTKIVVDALFERRSPHDPEDAIDLFATYALGYSCKIIHGDRYSLGYIESAMRRNHVLYKPCTNSKSDRYAEVLPLLNMGHVELPSGTDTADRMVAQFAGLERRVARNTGRTLIDHGLNGADDICDAVSGLCFILSSHARRPQAGLGPISRNHGDRFLIGAKRQGPSGRPRGSNPPVVIGPNHKP